MTYQVLSNRKILVFQNGDAKALVKIPYCFVYRTSKVSFIKDSFCDWEKAVLVDDEVCEVQPEDVR